MIAEQVRECLPSNCAAERRTTSMALISRALSTPPSVVVSSAAASGCSAITRCRSARASAARRSSRLGAREPAAATLQRHPCGPRQVARTFRVVFGVRICRVPPVETSMHSCIHLASSGYDWAIIAQTMTTPFLLPRSLAPAPDHALSTGPSAVHWRNAGIVGGAYLRPVRDAAPQQQELVHAVAGLGLLGDCHADRKSPRQVLLAGTEVYQRLELPAASLRESFTLHANLEAWPSGILVALGPEVRLRVMFQCEPCARLNAHQPRLQRTIGPDRGLLARVVRGGIVHVGDPVSISSPVFAAWSDAWERRLLEVAQQIPVTHVAEYGMLARVIGVAKAYCRVFPRALSAHASLRPRVVSALDVSPLPRWLGESLFCEETAADTLYAAQDLQECSSGSPAKMRAAPYI